MIDDTRSPDTPDDPGSEHGKRKPPPSRSGRVVDLKEVRSELRWTRKFGQEVKLGLLLRRTDLNDGQAEAVFGGFQGEGCS